MLNRFQNKKNSSKLGSLQIKVYQELNIDGKGLKGRACFHTKMSKERTKIEQCLIGKFFVREKRYSHLKTLKNNSIKIFNSMTTEILLHSNKNFIFVKKCNV